MKLWKSHELPQLPELKLAVIGHVEWVSFLAVDELPKAGLIGRANKYFEEPAGGAAVVAVQLARITKQPVHLITSLGKDYYGNKSLSRLKDLGLTLSIAWRNEATRRAISIVDKQGERSITVIGKRLQPHASDELPWEELTNYDGVFVTAVDAEGLRKCRAVPLVAATPRIGIKTIQESNISLDALIGSGLDPDEKAPEHLFKIPPKLKIATEGSLGGDAGQLGRYKAYKLNSKPIDAYGCGDSFAAGVTAGLAAGWEPEKAISLGSFWGAKCCTHFGPYEK